MDFRLPKYLVYFFVAVAITIVSIYVVYPDFYVFLFMGSKLEIEKYKISISTVTDLSIDIHMGTIYAALSCISYNGSDLIHKLYLYWVVDDSLLLIREFGVAGGIEYIDLDQGYIVVSYGFPDSKKVEVYNLEGELISSFDIGHRTVVKTRFEDKYLYIDTLESIRRRVYVVDLETGELAETVKHPSSIGLDWIYLSGKTYVFNPPFEEPGLYIASESGLRRILHGFISNYHIVHSRYLIVIVASDTGVFDVENYEVFAIDIPSSHIIWSTELGMHSNLIFSGYSLFDLYFLAVDWVGSNVKTSLYVLKVVDGTHTYEDAIDVTGLSIRWIWGFSGVDVVLGRYENKSGVFIVKFDGGFEILDRISFDSSIPVLFDYSWDRGLLVLGLTDSLVDGEIYIVKVYRRVI